MKNCKSKGFTLIEILIVVSILGIIVSIAMPSYIESVRKGKRADAKVELLRLAQMQEAYFVQNLSYAKILGASTATVGGLGLGATVLSEQGEYTMTVSASADSGGGACTGLAADACVSFTLTADNTGSSQSNDAICEDLTITNTGVKGETGTGTVTDCW